MPNPSDGLSQLLEVLPSAVREPLQSHESLDDLIEVVLDYGRPAEARFLDRMERMSDVVVTERDIDFVVKSVGEFGHDNRAGIERTLHRISCIRNRTGKIVGLTCRVGRALEGTIDIIDDIVRSGKSLLLLGKPGTGKTTKLREVARVLADEVGKRVVIVDTSNEIAGDGDVPHPGIGSARRMQVRTPAEQHQVMIEAVENHMPEVIIIDEIGNEAEALAARTIAERGVQLVGTAHGQTLENLMLNPSLADLVGGIQAVTLSDDEAKRRGTQKTVLERKAPPTFDVMIELIDFDRLAVHHNVQKTVDLILRGIPPRPEVRARTGAGHVEVVEREQLPDIAAPGFDDRFPSLSRHVAPLAEEDPPRRTGGRRPLGDVPGSPAKPLNDPKARAMRIFPFGIARTRLERAIRERRAPVSITSDIHQADAVIAMRSTVNSKPAKLRELQRPLPTVVVKSNTFSQIAGALDELIEGRSHDAASEEDAVQEAMRAVDAVLQSGRAVELAPREARIRKMQAQVAESRRLVCEAVGHEPNRRIRIQPTRL